ncbi:MAG: hypothetical protein COW88_01435 [Candidatus Lloydbacteria bacterium CG22_combo_CG10-13_8_21_14_all_47_15]|uniref:PABS domain-containing protein n=1 Tax=Candidatus Lloydbacteria bacterium CG22_combo_CG10-13_8_21_14_all_47_15 TaxID=1974635 RepID=A0A2H0CUI7_9BACT|nr:MAG: hypothetical protein COW88_01435 [Candidatus Lloydbacteria bacterium CG22_combo_CG10-13_8_21_14_all_47_15]
MILFLKNNMLPISVFVTGACVLIIEIAALRVLSPYYGNTIFTASSVISIILAALSVGYYAGGVLADRHPRLEWFFGIILASSVTLLALHLFGTFTLPSIGYTLSLTSGPFVFSILLFFIPAFLLGMLSPYAIKLQNMLSSETGVGTVAGKIFFWSTVGSILGSLMTGFFLIPHFGVHRIIVGTGVTLFLLGFLPLVVLRVNRQLATAVAAVFLAVLGVFVFSDARVEDSVILNKDGVYGRIFIYDSISDGRPARFLRQGRSFSAAMFLDSDDPRDLAFDYTKYYSLYKIFTPDVAHALVIGGGAYSIPKALFVAEPYASVDVVEVEPVLFDMAQTYFGAPDDPRLRNYVEDGRRFLYDADTRYDVIFSDVYHSLYSVPNHFTTREFFELAKEKLADDGVFIANIIGDLSAEAPSLVLSEMRTFLSVFPNSHFFAVGSPEQVSAQNIIFVGHNSGTKIDITGVALEMYDEPVFRNLALHEIDISRFDLSAHQLLTDDFSPSEYLAAQVLKREFAGITK